MPSWESLFGMPPRQPRISPASVLKMKFDEPAGGPGIGKLVPPAPATIPVGPPGTRASVGLGMLVAGVIVEVLEPWFAGHHGEAALAASPHGFTSSGSARSAGTIAVLLETMLRTA